MNEDDSINKPPLVSFTNKLPLIEIEPVNLEPICVVNEPDSSIEDVNGNPYVEFIDIIKSSYATKADLKKSIRRNLKIRSFQKNYIKLIKEDEEWYKNKMKNKVKKTEDNLPF